MTHEEYCKKAQARLRAARARKDKSKAWEISNTMRAYGCPVSLDGLKRPKRRKARKVRRRAKRR